MMRHHLGPLPRTPRRGDGFSLLEITVVLSILSVVTAIGLSGFLRLSEYWRDLSEASRLQSEITNAYRFLGSDFENIVSPKWVTSGLQGRRGDTEDNLKFWRVSFEDDRISVPIEEYNPLTGVRNRYTAHYTIDRNEPVPRLMRHVTPLGGRPENGTGMIIARGISGMRIQYYFGRNWRPQWDVLEMPQAIRISLSVMEENRPERQWSRVAVFPVHVR